MTTTDKPCRCGHGANWHWNMRLDCQHGDGSTEPACECDRYTP